MVTQPLEQPTVFTAWDRIDNQRYVLADDYGKLYLLMLKLDFGEKIQEWRLDVLGTASRANVLVYLDDGRVFLGSAQGDSQVLRMSESGLEVEQSFSNIAPVLDFTIMDMGNRSGEGTVNDFSSGQARIVAGSGAWQDGSLRSVRSGVGLEEVGVLGEMSNITDIFALKSPQAGECHDILLVSFAGESRFFRFDDDGDAEEINHPDLATSEQTLLATFLRDGRLLQVTSSDVQISKANGDATESWRQKDGVITAAAMNDTHYVLVLDGVHLMVFDLYGNFEPVASRRMPPDQQISCIALSPLFPSICVVGGFQGSYVSVLDLKNLEPITTIQINSGGEEAASARSLIISQLFQDNLATLLIGMADGNVVTYGIDPFSFTLTGKSTTILGTQEIKFKEFPRIDGTSSVFALCEHPSFIYASEGRIVYSAVTAEKATCVCPFDAVAYRGATAIATAKALRIVRLDTERKAHVQTLQIGETVRRVAYSPSLKAFGIGTIQRTLEDSVEVVVSHFKLADEVIFKEQDSYQLKPDELIETVIRAELETVNGDPAEHFLVGTSYLEDASSEDFSGRLLIFKTTPDRRLELVADMALKGPCRALGMVDGKIVAALYKTIVIYSYEIVSASTIRLNKRAAYRTATVPIDISITGSLIAVADMTKSVSVIEYRPGSNRDPKDKLVEVARHVKTVWATAVANIDENVWLESDAEGNLLVLYRDEAGVTADDKRRLRVTSEICLGEMVNRIRRVDVRSAPAAAVTPRAFIGTVSSVRSLQLDLHVLIWV